MGKEVRCLGCMRLYNENIHPLLWGGYKVYGVRICG